MKIVNSLVEKIFNESKTKIVERQKSDPAVYKVL